MCEDISNGLDLPSDWADLSICFDLEGNLLGIQFLELEIINQPQYSRRFRYISEFKSGSLSGENKAPITVKVNKYVDGSFIRCSLVDFKTRVNHPYCLVEKRKDEKILHDQTYYEVPVDPKEHTAKLKNIEIIITKDKNKQHAEILMKKEKRDGKENTPQLLEQINKNLKNIDLNVVALCFEAFYKIGDENIPLSEKIFSNAIKNSNTSSTAKLEIAVYRVFKNKNYDEVLIILKNKINIDKLEIKFYENGSLLNWQLEKMYYHQAVIIIRIPSDCVEKVKGKIKIELYRTTDEESIFIPYGISECAMETDGLDENDSFNSFDEKSLFEALIFDKFEKAKEIITRMLDDRSIHHSDCQSNIKEKALHLAILKNQPKIVKKLLDMGIDLNMLDDNENTALHLAIEASAYDCIDELLKYKDKINFHISNECGYMPLHLAIKRNSLKIVKSLVEAGAQINSINRSNEKTCLEMAQHYKQRSIIKYLQHKAKEDLSMDYDDAKDMTPVDLGPSQGSKYSEVFDILKTDANMPMYCCNSLKNNLEKARIDQKDHLKFSRKKISFLRYTCIFLMTFIPIIIVCHIFCNYLS
ncbi:uncharacterized protein LOC111694211 [Trichogramma pretiosum]|uniref:uncharacterized protein LOC111694211 n=1 Tax=Trichogramma pretiosum TaxID=7493 RepID=UPI000C71C301|nr:uncharacterized protein LOC111694211 [Trichogramma pretiosum]